MTQVACEYCNVVNEIEDFDEMEYLDEWTCEVCGSINIVSRVQGVKNV